MARIDWQSSYATGIAAIDEQHQQIIHLINRLAVAVEQQNRAEVSDILTGIRDYVDTHFAYEESLLKQSAYKFTASHIRGHRRFVKRLDVLSQRFEAGAYITRDLLDFLHHWLIGHIAHEDQSYVPSVRTSLQRNSVVMPRSHG